MVIRADTVAPFPFGELVIRDYTPLACLGEMGISLAQIEVPPGATHPLARNPRSNKIYVVLLGSVTFESSEELAAGDVYVVPAGERFQYRNRTQEPAELLLLHAPPFDLVDEEIEVDSST